MGPAGWWPFQRGPEVSQALPKWRLQMESSLMTSSSWRTYYDTEVVWRLLWGAVVNKTKQKGPEVPQSTFPFYLPFLFTCPSWCCFPLGEHPDAHRHVVPYGRAFTDRSVIKQKHKHSDGGVKRKRTYQTFEDRTKVLRGGNACGWEDCSRFPPTISLFLSYLFWQLLSSALAKCLFVWWLFSCCLWTCSPKI